MGGQGSVVHANGCNFLCNEQCGVAGAMEGKLTGEACKTTGNKSAGYRVESKAAMELTSCLSDSDYRGCAVLDEGALTACMVNVSSAEEAGVHVQGGGVAVLTRCTATECGGQALHVQDSDSYVEAEDCHVFGLQANNEKDYPASGRQGTEANRTANVPGYNAAELRLKDDVRRVSQQMVPVARAAGATAEACIGRAADLLRQACRLQQMARDENVAPDGSAVLMQLCEYFYELE